MSEEEMQRKMEFIVKQQAQFAADIQRAKEEREADAKLWREKYNGLTDALAGLVGMFGKLMQAQEQTTAQVAELAAAQRHTDIKLAELAQAQAETEERLNIFINVVERYISRNGRTPDNNSGESAPST